MVHKLTIIKLKYKNMLTVIILKCIPRHKIYVSEKYKNGLVKYTFPGKCVTFFFFLIITPASSSNFKIIFFWIKIFTLCKAKHLQLICQKLLFGNSSVQNPVGLEALMKLLII